MLKEHDIVALIADRPEDGLEAGDVGSVVHCYRDKDTYEIEFIDEQGRSKCVATIPNAIVIKLNLLSLSA